VEPDDRASAHALWKIVKLTPASRVYGLGAILLLALSICSRTFHDRGGPYFMGSLTVAGVAYLLGVREIFANPKLPRRVLSVGLLIAAIAQIQFLRFPVGSDDDVHRYVWDGRLQRLGYNPYLVVPSDPAAAKLHTPETRSLNNPDLPSPYPPGAQLFFRAVTAVHESTLALRIAFVICAWAIVFLLLDLLRRTGRGAHLVLAYAWNPLLALEVAGSGHIDIVGTLLLVVSAVALVRRWRATAAVALGLAIAVKFLPIVLLPLYWKRVRVRDAVLAVLVVAALYVPFIDHGRIPTGSLAAYLQGFRFNGPVFAALDHIAPAQLLAAMAVLVGLVIAGWLRSAKTECSAELFAWPMAACLLCAPAIFPWYLLWLLPFLTSRSTLLIIIWTLSIIPTYVMWHFRTIGQPWGALPAWVMVVEYGAIAISAVVLLLRRSTPAKAVAQ
jgi:alpha-1,6-mannosyltransferase